MSKLDELLEQQKRLQDEIDELRKEERIEAIKQIKALVDKYQIQSSSIFGRKAAGEESSTPRAKLPPRYRDPETGKTWTGQGREPGWIKGKNRDEYLIPEEASEG
jgi:DNA-binding protein H-NS